MDVTPLKAIADNNVIHKKTIKNDASVILSVLYGFFCDILYSGFG